MAHTITILSKHWHMLIVFPNMLSTGDAGYGPEEETCVFELTHNYGKDKYDNFKGEGYAQVALSSEVQRYCSPAFSVLACLKPQFFV